ncbi:MAG TPA: single-stranded DNA-binding protein [Pyrinomonadaceae bacterium]|nr:single-stranded DNA-binding protein [Pyrinomonadaceae bacterium]
MSFNKIIIVGNLGKDPELRYTPQGVAVCDFSMATNEKKRDKSGEFQEVATWFRVTLWRNQAENAAKYLKKGSQVFIEGRLSLEEWTDRDGNTRQTLSVQASDMHFIGSRGDAAPSMGSDPHEAEFAGPASASSQESSAPPITRAAAADDDIPF